MLGRYRPLRPLGSGGAGSVWLARDEKNGRDVALKIVSREGTMGPRAEREATAAAQLRHERCLRAYALARDSEHVYIAYEYVQGRTLRHALREGQLNDQGLLEAAAQILDGLAHAHGRGIVHRDVKPANVLLEDGDGVSIRILDFGLALIREEETLTAVGDIPGTLAYISPERLRGQTAGPAADIWAVGVLLWEGLAGGHPFWGGTLLETARKIQDGAPSLRTQRPDLPKPLVALVDRALSVEPRRRPSASRLAEALRASAETERRRPRKRRPPLPTPALRRPSLSPERAAPAVAAAVFAAWTATALPFYPGGWWAGLALLVGVLGLVAPRAGVALALAVPILPLGNYSAGLALVYAAVAAGWLAVTWREPRSALLFALGPVLGPIGCLGFLPIAGQAVRDPIRRAVQVAAAVVAAATVGSLSRLDDAGVEGTSGAIAVARALWRTLLAHPGVGLEAGALGVASVLLPYARGRGVWYAAGFAAAMLVLTAIPTGGVPAAPLVAAAWLTGAALAAEPLVRARRPALLAAPARK